MSTAAPRPGTEPSLLAEDRYFDPEPSQRRVARLLYAETCGLPLICPHGHVDPRILAEDLPFPEPTALIVTPDHYILRMLYSQGISMEALGVPARDGTPVEPDPRRVWQLFGSNFHLFRATPTAAWLAYTFHELFDIRLGLTAETALRIYDEIREKLGSPEFRPRALYRRFNIEVLITTDAATDPLPHHRAIREDGWDATVLPTFRPDALFAIAAPEWPQQLRALEEVHGATATDVRAFGTALRERRRYFQALGAVSTDHAVLEPRTAWLADDDADRLFQRARQGEATAADQQRFEAHMLLEMARLSTEDGLVMQLHCGALRDHNGQIFRRFGPDRGADIPIAAEFTRNLRPLLEAFGNDPRLTLVLFTLDEAAYARELAPLAGHYPAVRLGPPWWFHDSIEGMIRYRRQTTETAGFYNTAGFNDDTRAFCSIPARHDLARRVDANYLAGLVVRHVLTLDDARAVARALAYELARETYRLAAVTGRKRPGAPVDAELASG